MAWPLLLLPLAFAAGSYFSRGSDPKNVRPEVTKKETRQEIGPPAWSSRHYPTLSSKLGGLINSDVGERVYQGARVAPLSPMTQQAAYGLGAPMMGTMDPYWRRQLLSPTAAQTNLRDIASGYGARNPYLEDAIRATRESVEDSVNRAMAGAGRFGSVSHSQALARALAPYELSARSQQFNQDITNRMAANRLMDLARAGHLDAAGRFYNVQGQAAQRAMMGGMTFDQYNQRLLQAHRDRWNEMQMAPITKQARMQNLLAGLTGKFEVKTGTETTTRTPPYDPQAQMMRLIGAGLGNYGAIAKDISDAFG